MPAGKSTVPMKTTQTTTVITPHTKTVVTPAPQPKK
jgi:hypothetical protein